MYLQHDTSEEFRQLDMRAKEVLAEVLAEIPPTAAKVRIASHQDVFSTPNRQGKLYLLRDGMLAYTLGKKIVFYFEPGDLVGTEHLLTNSQSKILSDFAVIVDEYDGTQFFRALAQKPELQRKWCEYLVIQSQLLATVTGALIPSGPIESPEVRHYEPGGIIIQEGSPAIEVFTLIEGEAEALHNGTHVGEIITGEIFGVLASLTGIPRTATVKARTYCLAMVLPKEKFIQLIETRPATVLKMVEDMARTLVALNEKVVSLSISKF